MKSLTLYGSGTITIYGHDWRVFPVKASMPFKTCYLWPYCDDDFIKVMREEEAGFARGRGVASGEIQEKTMHNKEGRMGGEKKSDRGRRIERGIESERRDRKKKVVA